MERRSANWSSKPWSDSSARSTLDRGAYRDGLDEVRPQTLQALAALRTTSSFRPFGELFAFDWEATEIARSWIRPVGSSYRMSWTRRHGCSQDGVQNLSTNLI